MGVTVNSIELDRNSVKAVEYIDSTGQVSRITDIDYLVSSMPISGFSELSSPEKQEKIKINYQGQSREIDMTKGLDDGGAKMLVRNRLSRIYYLRKFFKYPINLSWQTLQNLGVVRVLRVGVSYLWARLFPIKPEKNLEEFFINRFGKELYKTFFKSYTEKVWGVKCSDISAEWGAQRIKGLSITEAIKHALLKKKRTDDVSQKNIETSLIERFLYPELGPGQMWELVGQKIEEKGGAIHLGVTVNSIELDRNSVRLLNTLIQRVKLVALLILITW